MDVKSVTNQETLTERRSLSADALLIKVGSLFCKKVNNVFNIKSS
jgi:hypothetical protein